MDYIPHTIVLAPPRHPPAHMRYVVCVDLRIWCALTYVGNGLLWEAHHPPTNEGLIAMTATPATLPTTFDMRDVAQHDVVRPYYGTKRVGVVNSGGLYVGTVERVEELREEFRGIRTYRLRRMYAERIAGPRDDGRIPAYVRTAPRDVLLVMFADCDHDGSLYLAAEERTRLPLWLDVTRGPFAYVVAAVAADGTVLPHVTPELRTFGDACSVVEGLWFAAEEEGHSVTWRSTMAVIIDGVTYSVRHTSWTAEEAPFDSLVGEYAFGTAQGHHAASGRVAGVGWSAYVAFCTCGHAETDTDRSAADASMHRHLVSVDRTYRPLLGAGTGVGIATMADVLADTCAAPGSGNVIAWQRRTAARFGTHTVHVTANMLADDDTLEASAATDRAAWSALQARKAYRDALERLAR